MLDHRDPLNVAAESLKWELLTVAVLFVCLYLLRETVLDAQMELEQTRRDRARLENELEKRGDQLDGALEELHKAKNGGD